MAETKRRAVPHPHYLEDGACWAIPGTGWTLQGHSQSGQATGFCIPELRVFLDAGLNSYRNAELVLVSHGHSDHSFVVPCIAMGPTPFLERPVVVGPAQMMPSMRTVCRASQSLNDSRDDLMSEDVIRHKGVVAGDVFDVPKRKKKGPVAARVRVVECVHRVSCVGFVLSAVKTKLKAEYVGMPGKELGALRKSGVAITEEVEEPAFTFLGDTTIEVFDRHPELLRGNDVIAVECTLLGTSETDDAMATDRGHICWNHLRPLVKANPDKTFVLIHFSRRYKDMEIIDVFNSEEGGFPHNVLLFLDSGPYGPAAALGTTIPAMTAGEEYVHAYKTGVIERNPPVVAPRPTTGVDKAGAGAGSGSGAGTAAEEAKVEEKA